MGRGHTPNFSKIALYSAAAKSAQFVIPNQSATQPATHARVLGQYYFGIRYAAAFFERFVVKTDRYQSAFSSQSLTHGKSINA